jgi:hypothetical protein
MPLRLASCYAGKHAELEVEAVEQDLKEDADNEDRYL